MTRYLVRVAVPALALFAATPVAAAAQDALAPAPAAPAAAETALAPPTDLEQVQSVVDKWVGDFNRGDFKSFVEACAATAMIIDGFPPYAWPNCAEWMAAYAANNQAISATHGTLTIGKPAYSEIGFDRAYIIYPATFTDTQKGKPVTYKGSWTMTLRKMLDGWTFTGSASAWGDNSLAKTATP